MNTVKVARLQLLALKLAHMNLFLLLFVQFWTRKCVTSEEIVKLIVF